MRAKILGHTCPIKNTTFRCRQSVFRPSKTLSVSCLECTSFPNQVRLLFNLIGWGKMFNLKYVKGRSCEFTFAPFGITLT